MELSLPNEHVNAEHLSTVQHPAAVRPVSQMMPEQVGGVQTAF